MIIGNPATTMQSYGIWAQGHVQVTIDHNNVSGTGVCGIGADGQGTLIEANSVSGCHNYSGIAGGQIFVGNAGSISGIGLTVSGNFIDSGGATSSGIELNGNNMAVIGNTVINQARYGIYINSGAWSGLLISGNTVLNSGQQQAFNSGLALYPTLNNVVIVGNRFADTQTTKTQYWGINFNPGTYNNVIVTGNDVTGNLNGNFIPPSAGTGHLYLNNMGVDDVSGSSFGRVGFNGTAAVAKPTVSGAKGSNAALASLLTALAAYGLITDTTTA